jgi:regulator of sirC expression with transglutaminase-like and TPR domain
MSNSAQDSLLEAFLAAVSKSEPQVDLLDAALLVAQVEYPLLDRAKYRGRVESMAQEAGEGFAADSLARIVQLNRFLFGKLGFHGNREDYYDPRNSFLNDVLDRRTGIPITLSLVYIEVGRRVGLPLAGIGLPGHFLVGCTDQFDLFVDAFDGGKLLMRSDCLARFRELRPGEPFRPEFLAPVGPRYFLTRMLNNLLETYVRSSRPAKALPMLDRILMLNPEDPDWLRRRVALNSTLKNYAAAARDLERYLALVPEAPDREDLARQLGLLHHLRGMVN